MKIEIVSNKKHVTFAELDVGEVFKFDYGFNDYFLKIHPIKDNHENMYNILDLQDNMLRFTNPQGVVERINAKLCIEDEIEDK